MKSEEALCVFARMAVVRKQAKAKLRQESREEDGVEDDTVMEQVEEVVVVQSPVVAAFARLPAELQQKILQLLHPKDLCSFARVCKRWSRLGSVNYVWWRHCMAHWWEPEFRPHVYAYLLSGASARQNGLIMWGSQDGRQRPQGELARSLSQRLHPQQKAAARASQVRSLTPSARAASAH